MSVQGREARREDEIVLMQQNQRSALSKTKSFRFTTRYRSSKTQLLTLRTLDVGVARVVGKFEADGESETTMMQAPLKF